MKKPTGHHHHQPVRGHGQRLLVPRGDDHRHVHRRARQWNPLRLQGQAARSVDEGVAAGDGGAGADGGEALARRDLHERVALADNHLRHGQPGGVAGADDLLADDLDLNLDRQSAGFPPSEQRRHGL